MSWDKTEYINRIEILDSGELFLGIESEGNEMYQYVYREAAGVYWDPILKGFKSTDLKDWTPSKWFFHIVEIAQIGVGVNLILRDSIRWKGIPDLDKKEILAANS
ncbi:MAG: hypothetical protein QUS14_02725 [Pyrinomonadaceae bacterium]|nr:hypothetical protein [Pyrinomonadaceae bacterium]